jgi:hypothetical protein
VLGLVGSLFEHNFSGFDDRGNGVTDLQLHFLGASFGYDAFDQMLANLQDHVGHNPAELEFYNLSFQTIAR